MELFDRIYALHRELDAAHRPIPVKTLAQRLTHYRDNWYLEAWCHRADGLRRFSLDRILNARLLDEPTKDIDLEQLATDMDRSYGIFSGPGKHRAVLLFTAERARWIADERWHPEQQTRYRDDGRYQLEIPYTDPRELVLDILRYGPDVEVLAPTDLRDQVRTRLQAALEQYQGDP
jgi:predicted DNA-binding transcriptional regulator YafY